MKITKYLIMTAILMVILPLIAAGPSLQIDLINNNSNIYTESKFNPLVFLDEDGGRILYNAQYFNPPPGPHGNITERDNNYVFTGEKIEWRVLVWDKNGVPEKIEDVFAGWVTQNNGPLDPMRQVNCQYLGGISGNLSHQGYPNVRRPGDQEAQTEGNSETMGEYLCTLTVEPNCHGQKWFGVKAIDVDGLNGTMQEAESWFCNPELDLTVSGIIDFGTLGPGEQGSSTFSVENTGEAGSGVEVVLAISGSDFYDPSSSGALCPTSNVLKLQGDQNAFTHGFWYKAVQGANQTPKKRIPYGNSIVDADPVFSASTLATGWADWTQPYVGMTPGTETSLTLTLGIPSTCNGQFTDGDIFLYAWAI